MAVGHPAVEDIFEEAIRRSPGIERTAYVDEACGTDADLRQRVDRLLRAFADAGSFLESPADESAPTIDQVPTEGPGTVIGPYKLLQEIGHGGMGVVFMAEQHQPVKRRVALKIIKPGMDSRQVIARFEAERQALSLMDHPNIAKVLDAGTTSTGRPYFVMELVKGQPITKYCDEHHMTPRERLELLLPVCQAIQHAHQKGIIHRDIKPSNILVAEYDNKPVPKVIDFGVAKAIHQPLTDKTMFTGFGNIVGTLEYMSPEQAKVNQLDIDTRSDIYSLGVLMYELLTGSTPFDRKRLKQAAWDEMLRIIREEEPQRPSTRISTTDELPSIAVNRGMEPKKLTGLVHGELDWIVMKALDKDRNRRYETANGFAMDLQRYLADEAVTACPPSAGYRFRKFVQRNRAAFATTAMVTIALIVGTIFSTWQAFRATKAEVLAENRLGSEILARKEAMDNFRKARQVVDQLLTRVGEERLADTPHLSHLRVAFLDDAVKFYQEFVRTKTRDPELLMELGIAWGRLGYIQDWVQDYLNAEKSFRQSISILEQLGEVNRLDINTLAELLDVLIGLSQLQIFRDPRDLQGAENTLRRCEELMPQIIKAFPDRKKFHWDNYKIQFHYTELYAQQKHRDDEVEQAYQRTLKYADDLIRRFPNDSSMTSPKVQSSFYFSRYLIANKRFREAATILKKAIHTNDVLLDEKPRYTWARMNHRELNYYLGIALCKDGKYLEGIEFLKRAEAIAERLSIEFPDVVGNKESLQRISYNKSALLMEAMTSSPSPEIRSALEEHLKNNLKYLETRVIEMPSNSDALAQLGSFYLWELRPYLETNGKQKESKDICYKALAIFEKLIKIDDSQSWFYWLRLGTAQSFLAQNDDAITSFNKSISLKPSNHAWHMLGDVFTALKQPDKAVQVYTKAISIDPSNASTWRNRAWNYTVLGQWDKAVADYLKAVSMMPDNDHYRTELAATLLKLGKTDEANSTYQKVMEQHHQDHHIAHHFGVALLSAGRKEEAQAAFRHAVDLQDALVTRNPEMRDILGHSLGHSLRYLVICLDAESHAKEQEQLLRKAVEQFQTLIKSAKSTSKSNFLMYQGDTYRMLGDNLLQQNRHKDAEEALRQAITCYSSMHTDALAETHADATWRRSTIDTTFKTLIQLLRTSKKQAEAAAVCQEAIRLFDKHSAESPKEDYLKQQLAKWRQELIKIKETK